MPAISVVMPSMNEENTIRTCIQKALSVFEQYGLDGEIIVVDNSTDRTEEIVNQFSSE